MAETFEQYWNRMGFANIGNAMGLMEQGWHARDTEIAELRAEIERLKRPSEGSDIADNLAMLLRRIVYRYEKGLDLEVQVRQIKDYMTAHKLWGSILRRESITPDEIEEGGGE